MVDMEWERMNYKNIYKNVRKHSKNQNYQQKKYEKDKKVKMQMVSFERIQRIHWPDNEFKRMK